MVCQVGTKMTDRQTEPQEFSPKKIAQKCPVCNGFGSLKYGKLVCHACKGKGYIIVDQEERKKDE